MNNNIFDVVEVSFDNLNKSNKILNLSITRLRTTLFLFSNKIISIENGVEEIDIVISNIPLPVYN